MVRHDPHGHSGESDPRGRPAYGLSAPWPRRRGEPARCRKGVLRPGRSRSRSTTISRVRLRPPNHSPGRPPAGAARSRSPCGSLPPWSWWRPAPWPSHSERAEPAVDRTTRQPTSAQSAAPTTPHGTSGGRGGGPSTSPGISSTTTTTTTATPPNASGPPVIAALNPASGSAGQAIQVAGANFLSSSGQIIATFDGQVASTSCPAQNTCSVTVPPAPSGSESAQVVITTAGGTSNTMTFTYS